jgi:hypothetical protein
VALLACDAPARLRPEGVAQVIDCAAPASTVVVDLGRTGGPVRAAAEARCSMIALLVADDVAGVAAARAVRCALAPVPVGVVVRGPRAGARRAAELVGAPFAARLPPVRLRSRGPLDPGALPRRLGAVADGLLAGLRRADPLAVPDGSGPLAVPHDSGGWVPQWELLP